jgi:ATP-dependent Clp protease ATP-binding subunit ClpA
MSGSLREHLDEIRSRIEAAEMHSRRIPPNEDLPLSQECKRALGYAMEEAAKSGEICISTRHLAKAILEQEDSVAARILRECGFDLSR